MATFKKKPEIVDARQFTGGVQNGTDLVFWVNSNEGGALYREATGTFAEHVKVESTKRFQFQYAFVGDWIMRRQAGHFEVVRPQELEAYYDQV